MGASARACAMPTIARLAWHCSSRQPCCLPRSLPMQRRKQLPAGRQGQAQRGRRNGRSRRADAAAAGRQPGLRRRSYSHRKRWFGRRHPVRRYLAHRGTKQHAADQRVRVQYHHRGGQPAGDPAQGDAERGHRPDCQTGTGEGAFKTPNVVLGVRGTEFIIETRGEGQ
jgi:hypothetical protein